jgi:hypothetical protein
VPIEPLNTYAPPFETIELRRQLSAFLDREVTDPNTGNQVSVGDYKFGVYAFFDYDGEPIYVGQTNERLRTRIRRHLTNQRTDAVAMKVLDPFEVYEIEVWPLPQYETLPTSAAEARKHLNWLELTVFKTLLDKSHFHAVLNEKDPTDVPDSGYTLPPSCRGKIVSDDVYQLRKHPDTRIARRAETLSLLAKVISERQVQKGLRRTLLTQAKRLAWLAERRVTALPDLPDEITEINDER